MRNARTKGRTDFANNDLILLLPRRRRERDENPGIDITERAPDDEDWGSSGIEYSSLHRPMSPQYLSLDTADDTEFFFHEIADDLPGGIEELVLVRLFVPEE